MDVIGIVLFAAWLANQALRFGPPEYFAMTVTGLLLLSRLSGGSVIRSLVMVGIGLAIGTVGMEPILGVPSLHVRLDADCRRASSSSYRVVECPPCVGVLPFVDAETVVLVGQYRYIPQKFYWEIPTGGVAPGESEEAAVQRELGEEAGHRAARLTKLCMFHTSKSVVREVATFYLAEDLTPRTPDETEFIEVRTFPFAEALRMTLASEIVDAMSVIAILHAARRRGR